MKAVLEPNEILIRIMPVSPSTEVPEGYYYSVQTKEQFRVYEDTSKMLDEIKQLLFVGRTRK